MSCESFIYTQKNALSPQLCNKFIDTFNKAGDDTKGEGTTSNGVDRSYKASTDLSLYPGLKNDPQWGGLLKEMIPLLKKHIEIYSDKYFTMGGKIPLLSSKIDPYFNIQHYKPGEGFFGWHAERTKLNKTTPRVLTWMFFLNNVTDGGGTQFYHQNHTEPAEQGKIVIFSSEWMHTHRGEVSPTQEKYIITGWANLS